ncbi:MAG: glycoside hydrolase family 18 protein [Anaerolineae bacterium]|nr:glycoside hydrolase family 18 protein [Anaerolineae bacterium]
MNVRKTVAASVSLLALAGVVLAVFLAPAAQVSAQAGNPPYRVVGYYPSYAIYEDYFVTDIKASQLTHLIYASIDVSANGQCVSGDIWTDAQYSYPDDQPTLRLRGNFRQLQLLRGEHPNLKILMSVGGWEYSEHFSDAAATEQSRQRFARSCVAFMRQYLFDGIDIDWRYPVEGNTVAGSPSDRANYTLLLAELRKQLDSQAVTDARPYLLTVLAPGIAALYENIELDRIHPYVDWINLMTFGFHGAWSDHASHHAPLYANTRDPRGEDIQQHYNVDSVVSTYLDAGIPASKLVIGVPLYAQAWQNVKPNEHFGLYQPASGVPSGTRPGGVLYWRDLLPLLQNDAYIEYFDDEASVPWLYSPDERIAISYDNPQSVREKARYIREENLGGMMLWQISFDDEDNSLVEVAYEALSGR